MVAGCYMTLGQALVIGGLHFHLARVLILSGLVRVLFRKELSGVTLNAIDGVLIAWLMVSSFLFVLVDGTNVPVSGRLGDAYTALGLYILVRASVRTLDDILSVLTACAVIIVPLAVLFVAENVTGRNPFAAFGGVPLLSEIRNGRVRCQGPFLHSILAGTFGATAMPPFVGLWLYSKGKRVLPALAILSATIIVLTSGSSGPVSAFAVGTIGLLCWPCRRFTRWIRWGLAWAVLGLAVVMKQPVWFLIARLSDLTGGGGRYRSALIDSAFRHLDEWWLVGTGYTAHWMATGVTADPNSADIVNQFVAQGVRGGLLALVLFVWLLVKCFQSVGMAVRSADSSLQKGFLIWSIGCALLGHIASFFSVSYFDQITIFWYLHIGMAAALASGARALARHPIPVTRQSGSTTLPRFARVRPRLAPATRTSAS